MSKLTPEHLALGALVAGVGFVLWKWGVAAPSIAANWTMNIFDRGNRLSDSTVVSGIVSESVATLVAQASDQLGFTADDETYSLARMGRSEGVDGMEYRMHVVLNDIADLVSKGDTAYDTITKYMTHSKIAAADGHYSAQNEGKRVSTSKDPYVGDYQLAQTVLSDRAAGIDKAFGATKFVDKSGPFYVDGTKTDYDGLVASWAKEGLTPVDSLPGATSNFVIFVQA